MGYAVSIRQLLPLLQPRHKNEEKTILAVTPTTLTRNMRTLFLSDWRLKKHIYTLSLSLSARLKI